MKPVEETKELTGGSWVSRNTGSLITAGGAIIAAIIAGVFLIPPDDKKSIDIVSPSIDQRRSILKQYEGKHFIVAENDGQYSLRFRDTPQPEKNSPQWQIKSVGQEAITIANDPTPYTNKPDDRKENVINIRNILTFIGKNKTYW